ncbi:hypothetical protein K2173_000555 [Erythroxylum novogranatense]|uniref:Uncharacterized protein n=1 Tax=Erythroxylum novogranatense TaxID=1862640 RepID=A0AAV8S7I7_9ROSI|nr:hypothetical protein K2173_000555 [Erythroxylum novogranatense]
MKVSILNMLVHSPDACCSFFFKTILFFICQQKLVINVTFNGNKSRSKAMKIAVGFAAVESVAIGGEGKNKIEVVGDGVDAVKLTSLLRKRVGYAVLETVAPVEKKEEKKPAPPPLQIQPSWSLGPYQYVYEVRDQYSVHDPSPCSIL